MPKNALCRKEDEEVNTISSLEVAEMLAKEHWMVLRDIEGNDKVVGIISTLAYNNFVVSDYFIKSSYQDRSGKSNKCYKVTKMGCEMLGNKQQGEKGILFTAKYVDRFNKMEHYIKQSNPLEGISTELQAIIMQDKKLQVLDIRIGKLENEMTIDYGQQLQLQTTGNNRVIQVLGGKHSLAYKLIGKKAFKEIWKFYKNTMNIASYKDTAVKEFERGKELLLKWTPSQELDLMIKGANMQAGDAHENC